VVTFKEREEYLGLGEFIQNSKTAKQQNSKTAKLSGATASIASVSGEPLAASGVASPLEERINSLEQQVQQLLEENSRMSAALRSVQLAQRTSSGTALEAAQGLQRLQDKVVQLQGADARTEQLERQLGHVQSRQQRMAEQQHLDDCQRSVIYKTPTPLPSQNAERAKAAAEQLSKLLGQPVAVLSAQELCGRPGSNGSGRRSVYKVRLASSEARDVVLRVKAARLRGTQYTIDVCLTPQQKARVDQLLPIAKAAKQAGQRVQWRYDRLYIDGKEHQGMDSWTAGQPPSPLPAPGGVAEPPAEQEEGEWEVPSQVHRKMRRQQQQQPSKRTTESGMQLRRRLQPSRDAALGGGKPGRPASKAAGGQRDATEGGQIAQTTAAPKAAGRHHSTPARSEAAQPALKSKPAQGAGRKHSSYAAAAAKEGKENINPAAGSGKAANRGSPSRPPPAKSEGAQRSSGQQQQRRCPSDPPTLLRA
jgi:hypothetical protein